MAKPIPRGAPRKLPLLALPTLGPHVRAVVAFLTALSSPPPVYFTRATVGAVKFIDIPWPLDFADLTIWGTFRTASVLR